MAQTNNQANSNKSSGKAGVASALIALIGITASVALLELIPTEESGRIVSAEVSADGTAQVTHVAGRQYLKAYLDVAGVPTACDGITRGVQRGQRYSEEQCTALLIRELEVHARGVMRCAPSLSRAGREYQRVAAISLAYNIGVSGFCGSSARRFFEAGAITAACERFVPWHKARVGGKLVPVRGLRLRREREREICLTGITPGRTPANLKQRMEHVR